MKTVNMNTLNEKQILQAAQILVEEFPIWMPSLEKTKGEIAEFMDGEVDAVLIAALHNDEVIGFIGLQSDKHGPVYEIHPLVVRNDWQRKGIGSLLINEVTEIATKNGGVTLHLSTSDDEHGGETSLANVDLYDDLPRRLQEFNPGNHQTAFYMKHGFKIVGVVPDEYGIGKPNIFLAKRL